MTSGGSPFNQKYSFTREMQLSICKLSDGTYLRRYVVIVVFSVVDTDKTCHMQFMQIFPRYSRMSPNHFLSLFTAFDFTFLPNFALLSSIHVRMTNKHPFAH